MDKESRAKRLRDKESLTKRLEEIFGAARQDGLDIDQFNLTLSFYGINYDAFTLNVSAPSLSDSCRAEGVIYDVLWNVLTMEEKMLIDHVRVFDSKADLKRFLYKALEEQGYIFADSELMPKFHEVA